MLRSLLSLVSVALLAGAASAQPANEVPADFSGRAVAGGLFASPLTLEALPLRGLAAGVASRILTGGRGGDVSLRVLAVPVPGAAAGEDGAREVLLFIELDGAGLLDAAARERLRLELYAYVLTATGSVAGHLAEVFTVDVPELGEAVWQAGLQYVGRLEVAAGDYVVRVLVRESGSGVEGLDSSVLHVPAPGEPTVVALFPVPDGRDAWVPVRGSGLGADRPRFVVEGREVRPTALPVLVSRDASSFYLFTDDVAGSRATAGATVELRRGEEVLERAPLVVAAGDQSALAGATLRGTEASFTLENAQTSAYRLFVRLADGASSGGQEVAVAPPRTGALLWTDLRLGTAGASAQATAVEGAGEERRSRRERREEEAQRAAAMATQYREALATLSAGDAWSTRTALLDFESRVIGDLAATERLVKVERKVAQELAERDPESLVPLIDVHAGLYQVYRDRRRYALLAHTRHHAEWLAELYAERVGTPGAHVVAARALASLAGHLQEAILPAASRRLYQRAIEHEPTNEAAFLGLATSYERYAEYREAAGILRRLVAMRPGLAEGRLRLAINLARIGDRTDAEAHLRQILDEPTPEWVRVLAHEELARRLAASGRADEAIELLMRASRDLGDPPSVLVLLAHLLDRQGRPHQALGVLSRVEARRAGDSPRKRYDGWPETALAEARRELEASAASRIPLLRAGLGVAG